MDTRSVFGLRVLEICDNQLVGEIKLKNAGERIRVEIEGQGRFVYVIGEFHPSCFNICKLIPSAVLAVTIRLSDTSSVLVI